MLSEQQVT